MNEQQDFFTLSAEENRGSWAKVAIVGGWLALFALIVVTGVHAVTLVKSQLTDTAGVMGTIRLLSPILTEAIVAIVSIGFAAHVWRANQRLVGLGIEVLWLLFASLNLVTAFNLEGSTQAAVTPIVAPATVSDSGTGTAAPTTPPTPPAPELPGLLYFWLHYGLPISALAAGALFYTMLRLDPEHQRQTERKATAEAHKMAEFAAQRSVLLSPQMASVLRQRGWLAVVEGLERQGYTQEQIRFMLSGVPQLQALSAGPTATQEPEPTAEELDKAVELLRRSLALNGRLIVHNVNQEQAAADTSTSPHEPQTEPVVIYPNGQADFLSNHHNGSN